MLGIHRANENGSGGRKLHGTAGTLSGAAGDKRR
jgi:hypothetical protein